MISKHNHGNFSPFFVNFLKKKKHDEALIVIFYPSLLTVDAVTLKSEDAAFSYGVLNNIGQGSDSGRPMEREAARKLFYDLLTRFANRRCFDESPQLYTRYIIVLYDSLLKIFPPLNENENTKKTIFNTIKSDFLISGALTSTSLFSAKTDIAHNQDAFNIGPSESCGANSSNDKAIYAN